MNWQAVRDQLLLEARKAYEESQKVLSPPPGGDDLTIRSPEAYSIYVTQGLIHSAKGDILKAIASALNEGLKP